MGKAVGAQRATAKQTAVAKAIGQKKVTLCLKETVAASSRKRSYMAPKIEEQGGRVLHALDHCSYV